MDRDIGRQEVDVVILSALNVELRAIEPYLTAKRIIRHDAGTLFVVGMLGETQKSVAATVTGEGNHAAAIVAERAIRLFRPRALVFVGIAGSLRPGVRLGDVVVATRVYAYHGGREGSWGRVSYPRSWEAPHELIHVARFVDIEKSWCAGLGRTGGRPPRVHFGGIAAGEVVLNSRSSMLAGYLRRHYGDAIAVEMESAGVAQAGHLNRSTPTLTIRAISDAADGTKAATDAHGWQARAAANGAAFATALIERIQARRGSPRPPRQAIATHDAGAAE